MDPSEKNSVFHDFSTDPWLSRGHEADVISYSSAIGALSDAPQRALQIWAEMEVQRPGPWSG